MLFAFVGQNEVIYFGIFGAFVFGVWSVLSFLSNRNSRASERLDRLSRPGSVSDMEDPKLNKERFQGVMETAKALAGPLMPKTELEQSQLKVKLANAGFRSESAAKVYLGLRFITLLVFLAAGLAYTFQQNGLNLTFNSLIPLGVMLSLIHI